MRRCEQQRIGATGDAPAANVLRATKLRIGQRAATQEIHCTEDITLLVIAEREGCGGRFTMSPQIEDQHGESLMRQPATQVAQASGGVRAVLPRAMHRDDCPLQAQRTVRKSAGNQPATQRDVVTTTGKCNTAKLKATGG